MNTFLTRPSKPEMTCDSSYLGGHQPFLLTALTFDSVRLKHLRVTRSNIIANLL